MSKSVGTAAAAGVVEDEENEQVRFFTADNSKKKGIEGSQTSNEDVDEENRRRRNATTDPESYNGEDDEDEVGEGRCLTLRILQKAMPCFKKKSIWEASQGDVYKTQEVEETKYPIVLKILESKVLDVVFVTSCLASIYLFFFSEGFIIESKVIWGIIHLINAIYIFCLFGQWLQILIKTRYSKTNRGYTRFDVIFTLLCIFPSDLIVLAIYTLTDNSNEDSSTFAADGVDIIVIITISRLNYLLRIFNVLKYFSNWENQLAIGDFFMFTVRIGLYIVFFIHTMACIWHRLACEPFQLQHFKMTPSEATAEVCKANSWIMILLEEDSPLLNHKIINDVLLAHYSASLYWAVTTSFRLGYGDIKIYLTSNSEVIFTCVAQIAAWIMTMATVSGTLTSLLIENDTERENFLTRRTAIKYYLNFSGVPKSIMNEVQHYYDHLWLRRKGILHLNLIDKMPKSLKSEVFHDINKDVFKELPLLANIDQTFAMNLAVHMTHTFYLEGEILFKKNEIGNCMYYVLKGYLEVMSSDESQPITIIHSGSVIGEIFLVHSYPHPATVRLGSDSEIVVLTKQKFKEIISTYPQFEDVFRTRVETRLEESSFFLNLCEKHNDYVTAFSKLHHRKFLDLKGNKNSGLFIFSATDAEVKEGFHEPKTDDDVDDLPLPPEAVQRFSVALAFEKEKSKIVEKHLRRHSLEEKAFSALESDVNRAGTLAKDLGIPIPPLVVSAPVNVRRKDRTTIATTGQSVSESKTSKTIRRIRGDVGSLPYFVWKSIVSVCILTSIWFYLHEWGFSPVKPGMWNYIAHSLDAIIAIDFCFDMLQIVVISPQNSLSNSCDILAYRVRTVEFYIRFLGFLPWEYLFKLALNTQHYFYLLKMNRCLELIVVAEYFQGIEAVARAPILIFLVKFSMISMYVIHFFAVSYAVIKRDVLKTPLENYAEALYWATQIITSTGFGDLPYSSEEEVLALTFGLIIGTIVLTYLGAKIAALLANSERRRVSFKQTYYAVQRFMEQRHFPHQLAERVTRYYDAQWRAHEGVLIPTEKSAIWDAPETIVDKVALAQCEQFTARSPLIKFASIERQMAFSKALKQYFVPPGEIILYPGDRRRELYIIVKGYCQVFSDESLIGSLSEGRFFGMHGLIHGSNRHYLIKTETHCQFLCLLFDDFISLARECPALLREFRLLRGEIILDNQDGLTPFSAFDIIISDTKEKPASIPDIMQEGQNDAAPSLKVILKTSERWTPVLIPTKPIKPFGIGLVCWVIFRTCAAVLVTIFVTAQACYAFHPLLSLIIMFWFDIIAWIDIVVRFTEAYYGDHHQLIQNRKKIVIHYLKGSFFFDLIACTPFEYGVIFAYDAWEIFSLRFDYSYGGKHIYYLIAFIRLNRAAQCYRIFVAENYLKKNIFKSLSLITLLEVVPIMFLFIHAMACVSILMVCNWSIETTVLKCDRTSWIRRFKPLNPNTTANIDEQNYLPKPDYDLNPYTMYTIGIYWVTQCAVNAGFGDVLLEGKSKHVAIFIILSGCIASQYLGAKLTACLVGEDYRRILLRHQMGVMFNFLTQYKVAKPVQRRVEEMYYNAWDKTKGISPSELFVALHPTLKADVTKQLYENKLRHSRLLKHLDDSGIRMLSSRLEETFYPEGEFIIRFGDLTDDVYIISTGVVSTYSSHGVLTSSLAAGSLFGEISALFQVERLYSVKAATDVDMFVISRAHFMDFLSMYPDLKAKLEFSCLTHLKESIYQANTADLEIKLPEMLEGGEFDSGPVHRWSFTQDVGSNMLPKSQQVLQSPVSVTQGIEGTNNLRQMIEIHETDNAKTNLAELEEGVSSTAFLDPLRIDIKISGSKLEPERSWWTFPCLISFGSCTKQNMKLIHIIPEIHDVHLHNFAVHPASPLCSSSISVCLFLLITCASCSIVSFELAFTTVEEYSKNEIFSLSIIRWSLETFFIIRFIGNFFLAYYDINGVLVADLRRIIKSYTSRWGGLAFDVVTVLPIAEIARLFQPPNESVFVAHIRCIKLLRVILFIKYLNDAETDLRMKASHIKIVKISIIFCFIFHFCACAWYVAACYGSTCIQGSWVTRTAAKLEFGEPKLIDGRANITIEMWYFFSLFYVTTAITFTGLSNIEPSTLLEIWITIFFIFATIFIIGYLVGKMTQCLASQVNHKIHYQHELVVLEEHFKNLALTKPRRVEVHSYYKLLYQKCKGMSYYKLIQSLPYPLRADIGFEIFGPNVKSARILHRMDEYILRQICARIKFEFYLPGAHIIRNGDVCDAMYFIKRGEIVILDQTQNLDLCVEILYENECFGEVKLLLPSEQYRFSYIARLESELGVLTRTDLDEVLNNYPILQVDLKDRAYRIKLHRLNVQAEEERAIKYDLIDNENAHEIEVDNPELT